MDIKIVDIFWNRIYLNIIFQGNDAKRGKIFLISNSEEIELDVIEIEKNKYKTVINITNIPDIVMLKNKEYKFIVKQDKVDYEIGITNKLGYKLETLDKIYRYSNHNLAYTVNFEAKSVDNRITCILVSRFMIINENYKKEQIRGSKKKIKKAIFVLGKNCFNMLYKLFSGLHLHKKNRILLMSETRAPIGGNLKALDERLKKRELNKTLKISYSFFKTLELSKINVMLKYLRLIWLLSKQEIVFVDDYCPIFKFINLSKKTSLVQLWHAGIGFKSVGYSRFGFAGPYPYTSCHRRYDNAVVGAEKLVQVYSEVFGISQDKILPYGLPRLDNFFDKNRIESAKNKIYEKYPILEGRNVILFAPTFRGSGQRTAYYPYNNIDLKLVKNLCEEENYVFAIKMHPFVRDKIKIAEEYKKDIIDLSDYPDINELFYITDILITDYSSNIYEFSLMNRPIIFYTFDLDCYQIINKVHRPIHDYAPGKICMKFSEVVDAIKQKDFDVQKLEKFRKDNISINDKKASDLIIDNIILKRKNND